SSAYHLQLVDAAWPPAARFPHNAPHASVGRYVLEDLRGARSPLIVSGYTSLDLLVSYLADHVGTAGRAELVRILLGHEPNLPTHTAFRLGGHRFAQDIADYWLARGISLYLS